jgi:hypothetical protein
MGQRLRPHRDRVAPQGFSGTLLGLAPDVGVPAMMADRIAPGEEWLDGRASRPFWLVGKLADGATPARARTVLDALALSLMEAHPDDFRRVAGLTVIPQAEGAFHPYLRTAFVPFLGVLAGAVALLLLLAVTNTAGLGLARLAERTDEMALRRSLGGGGRRLVLPTVLEAGLLSALAAVLALAAAYGAAPSLSRLVPPMDIPLAFDLRPDLRILPVAVGLAVLPVLLAALAPLVLAASADPRRLLRGGGAREVPRPGCAEAWWWSRSPCPASCLAARASWRRASGQRWRWTSASTRTGSPRPRGTSPAWTSARSGDARSSGRRWPGSMRCPASRRPPSPSACPSSSFPAGAPWFRTDGRWTPRTARPWRTSTA